MAKSRTGIITAVSIVLAVGGVIIPVTWDWYKTTRAIELQQLGLTLLLSDIEGVEGLQFSYNGRAIPNLAKLDLVLVNSGRTPILAADVLEPIRVYLDSAQILDLRLEHTVPANVRAFVALDSTRAAFTITFPLLNPADELHVTVVATGHPRLASADARILGVRRLTVSDRGLQTPSRWRRISWTVYLVGAFATLAAIFLAGGLYVVGLEDTYAEVWRSGLLQIPELGDPETYRSFLSRLFGSNKADELEAPRNYLAGLSNGMALTEEQRTTFINLVARAATDTRNIRIGTIVILVLFLIAVAYFLVALL